MYFCLFDSYTYQPKYAREAELVSLRLADLGIVDEKARASALRPIEILIKEILFRRNCENLIAVGNDRTANLVINEIIRSRRNITFGFIPIGPSRIGEICGIPEGAEACKVIAARRIKTIDLGRLDHMFFMSELEIKPENPKSNSLLVNILSKFFAQKNLPAELEFNGISAKAKIKKIIIANILSEKSKLEIQKYGNNFQAVSADDGMLDIFLITSEAQSPSSVSNFKTSEVNIKVSGTASSEVDFQKKNRFFKEVGIKPKALNIIVGKNRSF